MTLSHKRLVRDIVMAMIKLTSGEKMKYIKVAEDFVSRETGDLYRSIHALATVHDSRISFERRQEILHEIARAYKEANLMLLRPESRTKPGSVPQQEVASHTNSEHTGYIYFLSNEGMPGLLKVGFTTGTVEKRADEIGASTGVPVPFKVERTFPVYENLYDIEREIHATLGHCRVSEKREFFRISVRDAVLLIEPIVRRACTSLFVEIPYQAKRPNQSQQSPR